jgi:uncharacterized protein YjbI with pentapeptide repeats
MTKFSIETNTIISGHKVRHSDIIKKKKEKIKNLKTYFSNNNDDDSKEKKHQFLELCEYLVRGLRDRYSGNKYENGNKKLLFFSHLNREKGTIKISISGVLTRLKDINNNFTEEDAKKVIALCTHRHTSFSRLESYPKTLKNILKELNIISNEKSILYSIKRSLSQVYYYICLKYDFSKDFTNCDLSWMALSSDMNLRRNFNGADLRNTNFAGYTVDFTGADLRNTNFTRANFASFHVDFTRANLNTANFAHANFSHVDYSGNRLQFTAADLKNVNFTRANFAGYTVDFTGTDLKNVNFTDADLPLANFTSTHLLDTNLTNVYIRITHFFKAIFDENTKISLRFGNNLDLDFNHINNQSGTILTAIHSIDAKYVNLKNNLMSQVFDYLKDKDISLIHNALSNIIINSFDYTKALSSNPEFSNNFFNISYKKGNVQAINFSTKEAIFYLNILKNLSEESFNNFVLENNGFFNQLIFRTRNNEEIKDDIKKIAKDLYNNYLVLIDEKMSQAIYNTYYYDDWSINGLIFTSKENQCIQYLYVSNEYVNKFLYKITDPENTNTDSWKNIIYFKNNEVQTCESLNFNELFNTFKLFQANYKFETENAKFIKLIDLLNLDIYRDSFVDAINKKFSDVKYVAANFQISLQGIFNNFFSKENKNEIQLKLTNKHINDILNAYNFQLKPDTEKAKLLLILSGIFAKYSSSSFFGTEYDSPIAIRYYAYGLMEASYSLAQNIFPNNDNSFKTWKNNFLGINQAFTCTAVLSDLIIKHCKKFNDYTGIIPPAWL